MKKILLILLVLVTILYSPFNTLAQISSQALLFDGNDDCLQIQASPNYMIGTSDFTIEAWIRDTRPSSQIWWISEPIFSVGSLDDLYFAVLYGNLFVSIGAPYTNVDVFEVTAMGDLRDSTCHHVAVVRQGATAYFYRDGILSSTQFINGVGNVSPLYDPARIGCYFDVFDGTIKEVKFWNVARTQSEIESDMFSTATASGMLGYWRCNETSGTLVNDAYGNHGTLGNGGCGSDCYPAHVTNCCGVSCAAPIGLNVTNITSTIAKLNWNTNDCALGYRIRYKQGGTTTWTTKNVNSNIGYKFIGGLLPNTPYVWKVRSKCSTNPVVFSAWSSNVLFYTSMKLTDTEESEEITLNVFPNPAEDHLNISTNNFEIEKIEITNLFGQIILSQKPETQNPKLETQIDVTTLAAGIYLLTASANGVRATKMFVRE